LLPVPSTTDASETWMSAGMSQLAAAGCSPAARVAPTLPSSTAAEAMPAMARRRVRGVVSISVFRMFVSCRRPGVRPGQLVWLERWDLVLEPG
jgi:hypothetical protein